MPIRIHIPTPMRQHTEGLAVVEVMGSTGKTALDSLSQKMSRNQHRIFDNARMRGS